MAYPYDGMFYPTLPEDTQDFPAVLSGVGRSLREIGRSTQYLPYDVLGAPVDIATLVARPFGYQTQTPVGGSDWLIDLARQYGIADKPTGSGTETLTRLAVGVPSPVAVPRAIGVFAQGLERASDITTEQANRAADALVRAVTGNPQATAPQVLQETAMPFMQAVAPRPSGLLETPVKSDLGFYSALEQATIPLQNKGTGSQFLAQIEKTAGVKPEEVKWTGLDEFLKSRQNVTKQEVQDYLAANRVDLQEVRLGEQATQWRGNTLYQNDQPLGKILDTYEGYKYAVYGGKEVPLQSSNLAGAVKEAEQISGLSARAQTAETKPKFSSYTLPGGENYREILLTLPQANPIARLSPQEAARTLYGKGFSELTEAEKSKIYAGIADKTSSMPYKSSHFDQPNILAHMRVNDRVVDGKKTLFIEEVQSDWHQAGRKQGYQTKDGRTPEQIEDELSVVMKTRSKLLEEAAALPDSEMAKFKVMNEEIKRLSEEAKKLDAEFYSVVDKKDKGVPDAPFKTTWHELSLKRAIQEASEKGYDQIAFTTGKTQAERYDLSKQVRSIDWQGSERRGATKLVTIEPYNGNTIELPIDSNGVVLPSTGSQFDGKRVDEVVGKEIAEKIMGGNDGSLSGSGLQIGGEGMKGFYDQILPKSLEKLGKKFDAKVGKTFIEGERTRDASGIPSMYPEKIEVWKMDITPKMRESVLTKGQPLFAATPAGLGLLGIEEE